MKKKISPNKKKNSLNNIIWSMRFVIEIIKIIFKNSKNVLFTVFQRIYFCLNVL